MITIFNMTENTTPLSDEQLQELFRCIDAYATTPDGEWLRSLEYRKYEYLWKADLENSDVMAVRPLFGNKIILQPAGENPAFWVQLIAPAAIHELRHIHQRKRLGLLLYCLLAPIGRLFPETAPLEKDAFKQQDKAGNYIGKTIK
jgi:hypothetical protein